MVCLAVPGMVKSIKGSLARVDFRGVELSVNIQLVPDVEVGRFVLVHAGFAIQTLEESEAAETIDLIERANSIMERGDAVR